MSPKGPNGFSRGVYEPLLDQSAGTALRQSSFSGYRPLSVALFAP